MRLIYIIYLLLLIQNSFATTFYISTKGSDTNGNGSISNPWHSLYKATSSVTIKGDIIHVMAGTYVENQQCLLSIGVSIEGVGITSILKSNLTADFTAMLSLLSTNEGVNGEQHISNLKFDGQNLSTFWGIYVGGRSNVSIHDITVVDFKDEGIIITGRADNIEAAPTIYATGNVFYNNTVSNCARYADNWGRGCLNIGGQSGMLIYDNTITQTGRLKGTNGWPIKYANGGYLKGVKIYNNNIVKEAFDGLTWDFAIELFNEFGLEIYNNNIIGSIDLNHQNKGEYPFSAYIHDNIIGPKKNQALLEDGIILEFESNAVIIEKNHLNNLGVIVYFTPRKEDIISNITINNNFCSNIGVVGGLHLGFAIRMGQEEDGIYYLENLLIKDNIFIADSVERPYWGIGILGVTKANSIIIKNNIIKNFSASGIVANPAMTIDTMVIVDNILYGNGWGNYPSFSKGSPLHYTFEQNIQSNSNTFSLINIKMNFIRPLYYESRSTNLLEFITMLACILSLWFCGKENIYVYPMILLSLIIYVFLRLDEGLIAETFINLCFIILSIYGWVLWGKRDKKKHRIIRTSSSSNKEKLLQGAFFSISFILIFLAYSIFNPRLLVNYINWGENFVFASAFTSLWLFTKKKLESWYWWIAAMLTSIPLFFIKHYLLISIYFCILFLVSLMGLFKWKKNIKSKK